MLLRLSEDYKWESIPCDQQRASIGVCEYKISSDNYRNISRGKGKYIIVCYVQFFRQLFVYYQMLYDTLKRFKSNILKSAAMDLELVKTKIFLLTLFHNPISTLKLMFSSSVYQSKHDNGWMVMKRCVQCSPVYDCKDPRLRRGRNWGPLDQRASA